MELKFPKNFFWGCATSSHQIEGNNKNNDWWRAEQEGAVPHKSGKACDSYNRYEEDFDLAKGMGNNAHRFSLEWSRIEPKEGEFNEEAINHYRKVIRAAKERGLEPFITLHHFTNPVWFADMGGWERKGAPELFARYIRHVMEQLGSEAKYWITINEPLIYAMLSYPWGVFPPKKESWGSAVRVARNMAAAHIEAAGAIRNVVPAARVGIAKNNNYFEAYQGKLLSRLVKMLADHVWNRWFFNKINEYQDFVGINYYSHNRIRAGWAHPEKWFNQNENREVSDFGWEIYPEGIYHVVKDAARYKKPVYIFENGIADADDDQRPSFIRRHLQWLHRAIEEGADVRGYFHWSLLDNFEWAEGFEMKFGLCETDFQTFERKPRESYYVYKKICEANALEK